MSTSDKPGNTKTQKLRMYLNMVRKGQDNKLETKKTEEGDDQEQEEEKNWEAPTLDQPKKLPITGEYEVGEQKYRALITEGISLYQRKEYSQAIKAFTQAIEEGAGQNSDRIHINLANCYIKIGKPELAIENINMTSVKDSVDEVKKEDTTKKEKEKKEEAEKRRILPKAILTKAEAYFAMGELEFALVYFQKGMAMRKDMKEFSDGVTKAKHAILDSIGQKDIFQPNPNYAISRPRKPLVKGKISTPEAEENVEENQADSSNRAATLLPRNANDVALLPPPKVTDSFLGELSLDYQFLKELKAEFSDPANADVEIGYEADNKNKEESGDDNKNKKESGADKKKESDAEVLNIINNTLEYLNQRGVFWSQQGKRNPDEPKTGSKTRTMNTKGATNKTGKTKGPHRYEMTQLQISELKYRNPDEANV